MSPPGASPEYSGAENKTMTNHPNRQVGAATVQKLRDMYQEAWAREWPHDDQYLRELWSETRGEIPNGNEEIPPPAVWTRCVEAMRENHPF